LVEYQFAAIARALILTDNSMANLIRPRAKSESVNVALTTPRTPFNEDMAADVVLHAVGLMSKRVSG
jgi:hypothetical protein